VKRPQANPAPLSPWAGFSIVALGVFMSTLDSSIVNVALPVIREDYHAPLNLVGWIPLGYLLTISVTLLGFGRRGDRKGRARVYREGLVIFTLASLLCGLAPTIGLLVGARLIQAIGASLIMAVGPAFLVHIFPPEKRGRAIGAMGVVVNLGLTSGPVLGGFLTEALSWRWIFLINLPIGLAGWWLTRRLDTDHPAEPATGGSGRSDMWGNLLWIAGLTGVSLSLNRIPVWGFSLWPTATLLLASGALIAWFILHEHRTDHPLLPLSLFRERLFSIPLFGGTILFVYTFIFIYLGPFYLSILAGLPVYTVGLFFILGPLGSLITAPVSGWLHDRWGSRWLTTTGLLINAATLYGLSQQGVNPSLPVFGLLMFCLGLGNGIFMPPNTTVLLGTVPGRFTGVASGLHATGRTLGMVFGVAVGGAIFELSYNRFTGGVLLEQFDPALHAGAFAHAWRLSLLAGLAVCLLSVAVNLFRGPDPVPDQASRTKRPTGLGA
jgi:EmrB/QacA subfamily drug resistance transporter